MQLVARSEVDKTDARLKRQAKALQVFIAKLMEPPMELEDLPLPDVELSPREVRVLFLLGNRGAMIMTDLASAVPAPLSTVTRIVDRLENKQLVDRSRSPEDRRIVIVEPSQKGKGMHDLLIRSQFEMAARMLQPLSNGEREILLELLEKLTRQA